MPGFTGFLEPQPQNYLVIGATGTLGRETIRQLLDGPCTGRIRCLSRDEFKLSLLAREVADPRIECVLGDIRDKSSIKDHFRGIDVVFHFAALKRVPELEAQPIESLKTNVLGTINAAECAIEAGVKHFVFSSTDKATRPINAYGASKFLSEKILFSLNGRGTNFSIYRWGNIVGSRGAALYAFKDAVETGMPAEITHQEMGRFWLHISDAVKFVLHTYAEPSDRVKIPPMKAASVVRLLGAIGEVYNKPAPYKVIGMRPGEKIHEDIFYNPETGECLASDTAEQFSDEELREIARGVCR